MNFVLNLLILLQPYKPCIRRVSTYFMWKQLGHTVHYRIHQSCAKQCFCGFGGTQLWTLSFCKFKHVKWSWLKLFGFSVNGFCDAFVDHVFQGVCYFFHIFDLFLSKFGHSVSVKKLRRFYCGRNVSNTLNFIWIIMLQPITLLFE